MYKVTLYNTLY